MKGFAVLAALLAFQGGPAPQAAAAPNVVLIYADDLGYGDLSCYGAKRIRTPHLDKLGQEGARFTQFYSCASVCSPSRVGLLTGRMPIRTGLTRILNPGRSFGLDAEEITLAEALKARGYATAMVGKWHLGHLPPFLPTRNGPARFTRSSSAARGPSRSSRSKEAL